VRIRIELTEGNVYDGRVWDGVERRELGSRGDGTVKEDLFVEDGGWCGGGSDLFCPQVCGEEETLVCCKVVVDSETALTEKHVRRVRSIGLYI